MEEKETIKSVRNQIDALLQSKTLSPCLRINLSKIMDALDVLMLQLMLDVEEQPEDEH